MLAKLILLIFLCLFILLVYILAYKKKKKPIEAVDPILNPVIDNNTLNNIASLPTKFVPFLIETFGSTLDNILINTNGSGSIGGLQDYSYTIYNITGVATALKNSNITVISIETPLYSTENSFTLPVNILLQASNNVLINAQYAITGPPTIYTNVTATASSISINAKVNMTFLYNVAIPYSITFESTDLNANIGISPNDNIANDLINIIKPIILSAVSGLLPSVINNAFPNNYLQEASNYLFQYRTEITTIEEVISYLIMFIDNNTSWTPLLNALQALQQISNLGSIVDYICFYNLSFIPRFVYVDVSGSPLYYPISGTPYICNVSIGNLPLFNNVDQAANAYKTVTSTDCSNFTPSIVYNGIDKYGGQGTNSSQFATDLQNIIDYCPASYCPKPSSYLLYQNKYNGSVTLGKNVNVDSDTNNKIDTWSYFTSGNTAALNTYCKNYSKITDTTNIERCRFAGHPNNIVGTAFSDYNCGSTVGVCYAYNPSYPNYQFCFDHYPIKEDSDYGKTMNSSLCLKLQQNTQPFSDGITIAIPYGVANQDGIVDSEGVFISLGYAFYPGFTSCGVTNPSPILFQLQNVNNSKDVIQGSASTYDLSYLKLAP